MRAIDLNCDLGEDPAELERDEALLALVTSANIACGGHAGDEASMRHMARLAGRYGVALGAHPGYPDREHFGRRELELSEQEIADTIASQVTALRAIAMQEQVVLAHVKPHGALYNRAARDARVAAAIGRGVAAVDRGLLLVGLAGSAALAEWRGQGLRTAAEAFADRRYEANGALRSRRFEDALITEPAAAAAQALAIARDGAVESVVGDRLAVAADTLCVHSDTPGARAILAAVRAAFSAAGIVLAAPAARPAG